MSEINIKIDIKQLRKLNPQKDIDDLKELQSHPSFKKWLQYIERELFRNMTAIKDDTKERHDHWQGRIKEDEKILNLIDYVLQPEANLAKQQEKRRKK